MTQARKLPNYLANRFRGWRATHYTENKSWFRHLAQEGQHPRSMLIACCDSRVHVTAMFGADQGEFFIHRNIANLVPPYTPDGQQHGTSAAVEYAVTALKVAHVIVVGHSNCGGVRGCRSCQQVGDVVCADQPGRDVVPVAVAGQEEFEFGAAAGIQLHTLGADPVCTGRLRTG